jgi:hypothetical protein
LLCGGRNKLHIGSDPLCVVHFNNFMMEIMYCDSHRRCRHAGKVVVVELKNVDGRYTVLTHSVRLNPQKHQRKTLSSKTRLQTEQEHNAVSMYKAILSDKQKSGFRFLRNGERIDIPHFEKLFKPTTRKAKSQPAEPTYRKLAI